MSQLQLQRISKEIIDRAERALVPNQALPKVVDDYFVQRLKQDEMEHAEVDSRLYDQFRRVVQSEVLPLYEQFRAEARRIRDRKQRRKIWQYVLGTVAFFELLEGLLSRGRSIAPQVLLPTAILYSLIGFIIYTAAQYLDDLQLARARSRLEKALEGLDLKAQTDADYDNRRQLLDTDVLRAEVLEILTHYESAEDFWRDYLRVREADPTSQSDLKRLNVPAFERFLRFHVEGQHSAVAREHRFNRLFLQAHEIFISRNRQQYVLNHLNGTARAKP
jgi:hypothetical protein